MAANVVIPEDPGTLASCRVLEDEEMEVRVGFQVFALTMMTFAGWCLLCIFLPTGMQAIPFNLAADWVTRPKPMKEHDFNYQKNDLSKKVQTMLQMGKKLIEDKKQLADRTRGMWMCGRWRAKSALKAEQH